MNTKLQLLKEEFGNFEDWISLGNTDSYKISQLGICIDDIEKLYKYDNNNDLICHCGTQIVNVEVLQNKNTKEINYCGRICVNHFKINRKLRICEDCGNDHKNRSDNKCNECRRKLKQEEYDRMNALRRS